MSLTALEITAEDLLRGVCQSISGFVECVGIVDTYDSIDVCTGVRHVNSSYHNLHVDTHISCPWTCWLLFSF
jgi:hypothetical protein